MYTLRYSAAGPNTITNTNRAHNPTHPSHETILVSTPCIAAGKEHISPFLHGSFEHRCPRMQFASAQPRPEGHLDILATHRRASRAFFDTRTPCSNVHVAPWRHWPRMWYSLHIFFAFMALTSAWEQCSCVSILWPAALRAILLLRLRAGIVLQSVLVVEFALEFGFDLRVLVGGVVAEVAVMDFPNAALSSEKTSRSTFRAPSPVFRSTAPHSMTGYRVASSASSFAKGGPSSSEILLESIYGPRSRAYPLSALPPKTM